MVLGGFKMESMLQSLYVENKAGYFFTRFCEKSGNKVWSIVLSSDVLVHYWLNTKLLRVAGKKRLMMTGWIHCEVAIPHPKMRCIF